MVGSKVGQPHPFHGSLSDPCFLQTYSLLLDVEDYERRYLLSLEGERPALMGERKQKICDMYDNLRGKAPGQDR